MKSNNVHTLIYLLCFLILPVLSFAEEIVSGSAVEANASVNFRDEIPYWYWSNSKIKNVVNKGDKLIVLETKNIKIPFVKNRIWLNVKDQKTGDVGWVYNGKSGEPGYFSNIELEEGIK